MATTTAQHKTGRHGGAERQCDSSPLQPEAVRQMRYFDMLPKKLRRAVDRYGFDPSQVYEDWANNFYDTDRIMYNIKQVVKLNGMQEKGY